MPRRTSRKLNIPTSGENSFTDYSRWRLDANDGGRHIWDYLSEESVKETSPQPVVDKFWLGLPLVRFPEHDKSTFGTERFPAIARSSATNERVGSSRKWIFVPKTLASR